MPYKDPVRAREAAKIRKQRRRALNPDKVRAEGRVEAARYRARHPDRVKAPPGAWRKYEDRYREQKRARRIERRKNHPDVIKAYVTKWRQEHPENVRAFGRRRRERSLGMRGRSTVAQVVARIAFYGGCCAYCGGPFQHLDHVIPVSRGGTGWPANLRPACKKCNLSKHAKKPSEWKGRQR